MLIFFQLGVTVNMYYDVLLLKGEKKRFLDTGGQVLHKCFYRGEGLLQHFNMTHFISQKPPAGWTAMNSKMSEAKGKYGFQNWIFIIANRTFLISCPHLI